ncbi:MAG: sterol desaturase family protein [Sphingomonadales bacterium]
MLNYTALLIPVFLLLVALEWRFSVKQNDNRYQTGNTVINMAIGAFDQFGSLFYFGALFVCLQFSYTHLRLFTLSLNWQQWVYAFFAIDFLSYWYHRFSHRINILWAGHITHHSSELFNFSNGFRTSLFQGINRIAFWMLLHVFGFDPLLLVISLKVSGLWDFLVHTTYIPKLGWLENILVTPSHHRVHHGKNDIYIDKNYGSILIIWDKIFGTFQEETETVQYGVKAHYTDNNPVNAITYHYRYLWNGIKSTSGIINKIKLLIMPPEWKPREQDDFSPHAFWQPGVPQTLQRYYAIWQLACCIPGFIAILFYKDILPPIALWYCMALCITSITQTALIFKNNTYRHFNGFEILRLFLFMLFLPWTAMNNMAVIYLLILYFVLSISYQLFMEKTIEKYILKKYIHNEKI